MSKQQVQIEQPTPSRDAVRAFVRSSYKHDRFEGRDGATWGADYSQRIVDGYATALTEDGYALISRHESNTGKAVWFDRSLSPISSPLTAQVTP